MTAVNRHVGSVSTLCAVTDISVVGVDAPMIEIMRTQKSVGRASQRKSEEAAITPAAAELIAKTLAGIDSWEEFNDLKRALGDAAQSAKRAGSGR